MLQHLTGWTPWAETAPLPAPQLSHGHSRDRRGTLRSAWRCGMVVWSFKAIRPCIHERLGWRRYQWSLVIHSLLPRPTVLAGPSDQGDFPDVFRTAAYDHVRSSPFLADILTSWVMIWGCILYTDLQIFTLWQKSKVGVRIIFTGVLHSKFYSAHDKATDHHRNTVQHFTYSAYLNTLILAFQGQMTENSLGQWNYYLLLH